jgi:hypothetical protein
MTEDYLWDKTGEDAEIQGLENALKAFRFQEDAPPEIPQKVFTAEKRTPRRFFQFGFAFAAFAAAVVVLSVVWFQVSGSKIQVGETIAETVPPNSDARMVDEQIINAPAVPPPAVVKTAGNAPPVRGRVIKVRRKSVPIISANKAILRETKTKEPAETLTAEERYAFNQLMLALSITGSQLRIVQDKINGIEDRNAVIETAK